jgi:predicted RNA-binding protein with PIN domain
MDRLIIDGYSLLYRDTALAQNRQHNFRLAREQLIRRLDRLTPALAPLVELVFDGRGEGSREQVATTALHLVYSPSPRTADSVIEQMVAESPTPDRICVVTSDRPEIDVVTAIGAEVMSCASFLDHLLELEQNVRKIIRPGPRSFTLGDLGDWSGKPEPRD